MNEEKQILCWVTGFIVMFLTLGGFIGWYLHPDTKEVIRTVYENQASTTIQFKVISVLAEKKECEEKGGTFQAQIEVGYYLSEIRCVKYSDPEIIFEYELTN